MLTKFFDSITRLSIRLRWLVLAVSLIIIGAGIWAMLTLNLELLPSIEFPQTVIVAQWSDAESADQFLDDITIPLEENLAEIDGVVNVESTTTNGFAFIVVRNDFGLNKEVLITEIEEVVSSTDLPAGVETPEVLNFSLSDLPVVVASASSADLSLPELKELVENDLKPRLEMVEEIDQVNVSGGQELPEEVETIDEQPEEEVEAVPEDPGRLPLVFIQGAKALGVDIEYAQDVTPEFLANLGLTATDDQVLTVLALIPPDTLRYAPPETLSLLPIEYMSTLDPELQTELDDLAKDFGGINQFTVAEAMTKLSGEEADVEPTPVPTQEPVEEEVVATPDQPEVEPVDLPDSWIAAAAQSGQELSTTADINPEVMEAISGFAPQLLNDLDDDMWRAIDPVAVAIVFPIVGEELDPGLLFHLQAIQFAANGEAPDPAPLPEPWLEAATTFGIPIETTADITAEAMALLVANAPELLDDLSEPVILSLSADVLAVLPEDYLTSLDEGLLDAINVVSVRAAQAQALTDAQQEPEAGELVEIEPVDLPESWIEAAAQAGQTIATTADLTPDVMVAIVNFAPQLLADLEPSMWRALDPSALFVAIPQFEAEMDPTLLAQLRAIALASEGQLPEPAPLPESWMAAAGAAGFEVETTAEIPVEAMGLLAANAPQLLEDLTEEMILALGPEAQASLPEEYLNGLDEGLQETLNAIAVRNAAYQASLAEGEAEEEETAEPEPTPDPARLPDILIQGAQSFGLDIEYAYDIPPEFMTQVGALGPQGLQVLQLLTPDNLRAMQPEVIALLPAEFLDSLDVDLRAELDDIAADFGGAGQLVEEESEAEVEVDPDAPPLSGIWLEPGPNGEPSQFQTATDILNNPFVPGAAPFLSFFPDSPQVEDPVEWMSALTPEVMAYFIENEEGFLENISPVVLEMMSPETLTFLLETYPESFDEELGDRLRGIALGDVEVFIPEATITRTDGDPSVLLNLFKEGNANTVVVAHRVFDELEAYGEQHPEVSFNLAFEQSTFIEDSISSVTREAALGALFAVVVILIFLSGRVDGKYKLSWRSTLVVAVSIPLSIFTALLFMRVLPPTLGVFLHDLANDTGYGWLSFIARLFPSNVTLNLMTLSGLTVAIGRVVDDSIVVLENTFRFIQRGDDPKEAAIEGTRQVAIAIFTSTLTTVAVFLPLGLLGGIIGAFFLPFGLAVSYALMASFVVAITVVPALAVMLIRKDTIPEERETSMQRTYTPALQWVLRHRGVTMLIATVIFVVSLFLLSTLPRSFIPAIGEPTINVAIESSGSQMAETDGIVNEFEQTILTKEGIETIQTEVGSGGGFEAFFGGGGISQDRANMTISVEDQEELANLTTEIREQAEEVFGQENVVVSAASQTGFSGFSLIVTGDSTEELQPVVEDIKDALATVDIDDDGKPDIVNISSNIDQAAVGGNGSIIRVDGRPAVSFTGELETDNTLGVTGAAKEAISAVATLPDNTVVSEGFESEQQTEGFRQMATAIVYSIIIVYIIMAVSFRSFIHPFTILFSLPFALVGAALALFISGSVLSISAMIGLMMLVGVVVTNAIVLLEYVQQRRERGEIAYDALVEGGRTRLRPIWMTALAAILALLPLALSQEGGALIASELAVVVIGGLLVGTLLTLLVVPVVYSLMDDISGFFRRKPKTES